MISMGVHLCLVALILLAFLQLVTAAPVTTDSTPTPIWKDEQLWFWKWVGQWWGQHEEKEDSTTHTSKLSATAQKYRIKYQGRPGTKGIEGPQGPRGPRGSRGRRGRKGKLGKVGVTGVMGPVGPVGERGPTGPRGKAGKPGIKGPTGRRGKPNMLKGPKGPRGKTGKTGYRGWKGHDGQTGLPGANGKTGAKGVAGDQGPMGIDGVVGPTGYRGERGPPGMQGTPGVVGPEGPNGPDGALPIIECKSVHHNTFIQSSKRKKLEVNCITAGANFQLTDSKCFMTGQLSDYPLSIHKGVPDFSVYPQGAFQCRAKNYGKEKVEIHAYAVCCQYT